VRPSGHGEMVADVTISVNCCGLMADTVQGQRTVATPAANVAHSATEAPAAIPRW
jgi:hypothetical protein